MVENDYIYYLSDLILVNTVLGTLKTQTDVFLDSYPVHREKNTFFFGLNFHTLNQTFKKKSVLANQQIINMS